MSFTVPYVFLVAPEHVERSNLLNQSHIGLWTVVIFGKFLAFTPNEEHARQFSQIIKQQNCGDSIGSYG